MDETNVSCSDGEIRLANGLTQYEGRVEICFDDTWGAVCSSQTYYNYYYNRFDVREAAVICRQLGLIPIGRYKSVCRYIVLMQ